MDFLWDSITEWLKELLVSGIINNLSGMFDQVNQRVGEIAGQVGTTPQAWNGGVFNMVRNLSETVIVPIAGAILAFVMTLELIQLIIDKNNLHDLDTWMFLKWIFKTASAILIVTNTWNIVICIFLYACAIAFFCASVWSETITMFMELRFTDRFQYLQHTLLHQPVHDCGNPKRTGFPIPFWYLHPADTLRSVPPEFSLYLIHQLFVSQLFNVVDCLFVCSRCMASWILFQIPICHTDIFRHSYDRNKIAKFFPIHTVTV